MRYLIDHLKLSPAEAAKAVAYGLVSSAIFQWIQHVAGAAAVK